MTPKPLAVNHLLNPHRLFPQYLFPLFQIAYTPTSVHSLWIKRGLTVLFGSLLNQLEDHAGVGRQPEIPVTRRGEYG